MPIRPPALDDRGFDDLVAEMLQRIPAHTPEWTNPQPGDPGRTLLDLTAWLADTILYRANLIPERQRLAFLRLLGAPMHPALPATGLVGFADADPAAADRAPVVPQGQLIARPLPFETRQETVVLPVVAQCYLKRRPTQREQKQFDRLLPDLQDLYQAPGGVAAYVSTAVFVDGTAEPGGRDVVGDAVDGQLWIALLAAKAELRDKATATLGRDAAGRRQVLSLGLVPALSAPPSLDDPGFARRLPLDLAISSGVDATGEPVYTPLAILSDSTNGLSRTGVVRVVLPEPAQIGAPSNDVAEELRAGVGARPPRIDDPGVASRLVAWLRLGFAAKAGVASLPLSWAGVNVAEVEQRQSIGRLTLGQGDGGSDQEFALGYASVEPASLEIDVETLDQAGSSLFERWRRVADVTVAGRGEAVYSLDAEAGLIRMGDGVRGRAVPAGMRVQAARLRAGGGEAGNFAAGTIKGALGLADGTQVKLTQPVPTVGGAQAESLEDAERRIPRLIRHQDRTVTAADFREIAARTPGAGVARVEVLPRFKPQQRRSNVPGVVSVMVLPRSDSREPPAPRPDRPMLEAVHAWLDVRRPLATELYVIGCEFVPLALTLGVDVVDPDGRDAVFRAVSDAVKTWLFALAPGGPAGEGWPLGRPVLNREIEVAAARVPGVRAVDDVRLFARSGSDWREIQPVDGRAVLPLQPWQLPELLSVAVADGEAAASPVAPAMAGRDAVAIPVVPEVC